MEIDVFWAMVAEVDACIEANEPVPPHLKEVEQWNNEWKALMDRRQKLVAKYVEETKKND